MPRSLVSSEATTSPLTADRTVAAATLAQGTSGSLTPSSVFSPARLARLKLSLFSAATFSFRGLNIRSYLRILQVAGIYLLLLPVNGTAGSRRSVPPYPLSATPHRPRPRRPRPRRPRPRRPRIRGRHWRPRRPSSWSKAAGRPRRPRPRRPRIRGRQVAAQETTAQDLRLPTPPHAHAHAHAHSDTESE